MKIFRQIIIPALGLILAAACICAVKFASAEPAGVRISVLTSHSAKPYEEAIEGFKRYLGSQGGESCSFEIYSLEGDEKKGVQALEKIKKEGTSILFTLGSLATRAAIKEAGEIPTIAGLILDGDEIRKRSNITGVVLDFPMEEQFQWMQRILPDSKAVGVIYSPRNLEKIKSVETVTQSMGIKLYSRQVETPSDIPDALEYLCKHVTVLWGIADELVFTSQTAKEILLISFRNRIPLVGISSAWVKAGALYSLDWDYTDMGSQCGEMALQVLKGSKPNALPPARPRKLIYSLNLRTALHMKIDLPKALIQGAHQVFK